MDSMGFWSLILGVQSFGVRVKGVRHKALALIKPSLRSSLARFDCGKTILKLFCFICMTAIRWGSIHGKDVGVVSCVLLLARKQRDGC